MSNPLAKLIQDSLAVLDAAGVEFLPELVLDLKPAPTDEERKAAEAKAMAMSVANQKATEKDADAKLPNDLDDIRATDYLAVHGKKLITQRQRRNKFVSDACSSRDGNAIATKMVLAKVSFTVARAQSRVNDKAGEATQAFAAAVSLVNVAEALCALHSVCDTGWTLPGSPGGVKPRKFGFATAIVPAKFGLTDKQLATERAAA